MAAGVTHVPVQLSQLASLVRVRHAPWLHVLDEQRPRNVWAVITNMISPAASADASSKAFTESGSALVGGSEKRSLFTAKAEGLAPHETDFENHPDLPAGVGASSDLLPSDQALAQELVARAVARAVEDAARDARPSGTLVRREGAFPRGTTGRAWLAVSPPGPLQNTPG